jgi:hypothetical protein
MRITHYHRAGHLIRVRIPKLAEAVVDEQYRLRPELEARYGPRGREKCVEDTRYHLRFLAGSVEWGEPRVFADYFEWAVRVMKVHGVAVGDALENLRLIGPVLAERLPPEVASLAYEHLDAAIARVTPAASA